MLQHHLSIETTQRGLIDISTKIATLVSQAKITVGLCHVFLHHTSASLIISENADASVKRDLEKFMQQLVADGNPLFEHDAEGPDDMPAHIRAVLTQSSLTLPITAGRLALGTWQAIYLWEHRFHDHQRKITVTINGV